MDYMNLKQSEMTFHTITEVYDGGPFINKIILNLTMEATKENIKPETFTVEVERLDKSSDVIEMPEFMKNFPPMPTKGTRKVIKAYPADERGAETSKSRRVILELEVAPDLQLGSLIKFNGKFNVAMDCRYKIIQQMPVGNQEKLEFTQTSGNSILLGDDFKIGRSEYEKMPLAYGYFEPKKDGRKKPLLIWFHGAGEGGDDPMIAIIGNKVVNLAAPQIQLLFGGAYVLAPQAPTMWMDNGSGDYTDTGDSMYVEAAQRLIEEFVAKMPDVDTNRIYVGGCSNGGFMTMKMLQSYPEYYAAAYPICEALLDARISDEDISRMKDIPIWFTQAKNDPVVLPEVYVLPTYKRLIEKGAGNVHLSLFDEVRDKSGRYFAEDGKPFEYNGHWVWIHALNNDCTDLVDGMEISLFEWLSLQRRNA